MHAMFFYERSTCRVYDLRSRIIPGSTLILGTAHVCCVLEQNIPLHSTSSTLENVSTPLKLLTGHGTLINKSIPIRCYCTHCIIFLDIYCIGQILNKIIYSKTCAKRSLSKRPKMVFKTDYRLMQVKSIAECSKGSILKYFRPPLSYRLSLRPLFCLCLIAVLHRIYCNVMFPKLHVFSVLILKCIYHAHCSLCTNLNKLK